MELPPALAARLAAREAARKEAAASLRQERSDRGDGADIDLSDDIATWKSAVSALKREAREAAQKENNVGVVDDVCKTKNSSSSSLPSVLLDSLGERLSQLELQAAALSTRIKGSRSKTTREGEILLLAASSAREALRSARASASPAFRLAAAAEVTSAPSATGGTEAGAQAEEAERKKLQEAATEHNASAVADAAGEAARLSGIRGKTLLLTSASFAPPAPASPSDTRPPSRSTSSLHLPSLRLEDLEDCIVSVSVPLGSVVATGIRRCVVFLAAPVGGGSGSGRGGGGAVLVDGAEASRLYVAAHQVRLHRMTGGCDVYVRSAAPPVLEGCSGLRVAPYPSREAAEEAEAVTETTTTEAKRTTRTTAAKTTATTAPSRKLSSPVSLLLPASEAELSASGLGSEDSRRSWSRCRDFSWPLAANGASGKGRAPPSPNWKRLPSAEREGPPSFATEGAVGAESVVGAVEFERLFPSFASCSSSRE